MKNRIVSLFQLEELLAPHTNGHGRSVAGGPTKKKRKARRKKAPGAVATTPTPPVSPAAPVGQVSPGSPPQTPAVAKSFDTGAPIHCEHAIAYPPVQPVTLPTAPSEPPARAESLDINVEAFEDEETPIDEPTLRLGADEESEAESQSVYDEDDEHYEAPRAQTRQASAPSADRVLPRSFASQMEAVEADLAALARRADHPPPNAPTPPTEEEQAPLPRTNTQSPSRHAIFDEIAKGMSYATEFRLPPVQLSQVFSALDRQLDAEVPAPPVPNVVVDTPRVSPPIPPGDVLLKDLVDIAAAEKRADIAAAERRVNAAASLAAVIDVKHDVPLVPQQTGYSCWAAGAAMVVGWRDRISVDPSEIARATGYWAQYAAGLNAEDTQMFKVWRLTPEAAQTYTVAGFADLLKRHGPLWVASAEPGPHIRVVTGLVGDGTAAGTLVYINDPWELGMASFHLPNRGSQYTESYQRFVEKQESLGRQEIKQQGIYVAHA